MQEITLAGARGAIAALRHGDPAGPKLLCLHGWLDNAASFVPLMPLLREFDLVALDLPGHGASAHRLPGYDYVFVDWIHDVLDALDALGWSRASLLGHSMGGAIATVVATSAPERVRKLALIEALGPISGKPEEAGGRLKQAVAARRAATALRRRVPASAGSPLSGPSASTSARRSMRSGAATATMVAIAPPIECPSSFVRVHSSASSASSTSWIQSTSM